MRKAVGVQQIQLVKQRSVGQFCYHAPTGMPARGSQPYDRYLVHNQATFWGKRRAREGPPSLKSLHPIPYNVHWKCIMAGRPRMKKDEL